MKLWLIAGAVAGAVAFVGGTYIAGHRAGMAACELRVAEAVAFERDRQAQAITAVLAEAATREADTMAEVEELKRQVDDYEAELEIACLVPETDAGRLNAIR